MRVIQSSSSSTKTPPAPSSRSQDRAPVLPKAEPQDVEALLDQPICATCGTQFSPSFSIETSDPLGCRICADPRQYVPPAGLQLTTLRTLRDSGKYKNEITPMSSPTQEVVWELVTTPKFAIGQRAIFVKTSRGNILWDLMAYLDPETESWIKSQGGLHAIVISHPHYYTTHATWAKTFGCQVWVAPEDREWLNFPSEGEAAGLYHWLTETKTDVLGGSGFTALKVGGHFPGSLCGLHKDRLFIADTLITVPSAYNPAGSNEKGYRNRVAYSFMWSIPNMIPLSPNEIEAILSVLDTVEFSSTHGAFPGMDVSGGNVKKRLLESGRVVMESMRGRRSLE